MRTLAAALAVAALGCGRVAFDPLADGGRGSDGAPAWPTLAGEWTWVAGSNLGDPAGSYGTSNVPAASNAPGARDNGASWFDGDTLWMFGGIGRDMSGGYALLNDLWTYDRATGLWTWVGGESVGSDEGDAGTLGVPSPTNLPGSRNDPATWKAPGHEVWMFGGTAPQPGTAIRNDLWRLDLETKIWTWSGGTQLLNRAPIYGTQGVAAPTNDPGARLSPVVWDDGTGDGFYLYGGDGLETTNGPLGGKSDMWHFSASARQWTWLAGPQGVNASSSRGTLGEESATGLPAAYGECAIGDARDGSLLLLDPQADIWRFDLATRRWTWLGGPATDHAPAVAGTRRVPSAEVTPGELGNADCWSDPRGNLWVMGGDDGADGTSAANALWVYQPSIQQWALVTGAPSSRQTGVYGTRGVPDAANSPSSRDNGMVWSTPDGELWLFGGDFAVDSAGTPGVTMGDLWRFAPPD